MQNNFKRSNWIGYNFILEFYSILFEIITDIKEFTTKWIREAFYLSTGGVKWQRLYIFTDSKNIQSSLSPVAKEYMDC